MGMVRVYHGRVFQLLVTFSRISPTQKCTRTTSANGARKITLRLLDQLNKFVLPRVSYPSSYPQRDLNFQCWPFSQFRAGHTEKTYEQELADFYAKHPLTLKPFLKLLKIPNTEFSHLLEELGEKKVAAIVAKRRLPFKKAKTAEDNNDRNIVDENHDSLPLWNSWYECNTQLHGKYGCRVEID